MTDPDYDHGFNDGVLASLVIDLALRLPFWAWLCLLAIAMPFGMLWLCYGATP